MEAQKIVNKTPFQNYQASHAESEKQAQKAAKAKAKRERKKMEKRSETERQYQKATAEVRGTGKGDAQALKINKMLKALDRQQIAIVSQVMTGRVALQYPDDTQRRSSVSCIRTSFPFSSYVDSNKEIALLIRPTLRKTITAQNMSTTSTSEIFVGMLLEGNQGTASTGDQLYRSGTSVYNVVSIATNKAAAQLAPGTYLFCPNLLGPSPSQVRTIYPKGTDPGFPLANTAQQGYQFLGAGTNWNASATVDSLNTGAVTVQWIRASTGAVVGTPATSAGTGVQTLSSQVIVGTTPGVVSGEWYYPVIVTTTVTMTKAWGYIVQVTEQTTAQPVGASYDMEASTDTLWTSTYKQSRVLGCAVWLQNSTNVAQIGGDISAVLVNPEVAQTFGAANATDIITYASSTTRDTYTGPAINGMYGFFRGGAGSDPIYQPSLDMDSGWRIAIGAKFSVPGGTTPTGWLHVFMCIESETTSKVLTGKIAPYLPQVIAKAHTAIASFPSCVMENSTHQKKLQEFLDETYDTLDSVQHLGNHPLVQKFVGWARKYDMGII